MLRRPTERQEEGRVQETSAEGWGVICCGGERSGVRSWRRWKQGEGVDLDMGLDRSVQIEIRLDC